MVLGVKSIAPIGSLQCGPCRALKNPCGQKQVSEERSPDALPPYGRMLRYEHSQPECQVPRSEHPQTKRDPVLARPMAVKSSCSFCTARTSAWQTEQSPPLFQTDGCVRSGTGL